MNSSARPHILVVDDEEPNILILTRFLTAHQFRVSAARDGELALRATAVDPPTVILLDVGMPGMNGFEVCRRLKNDPLTMLTPIVLVTGRQGRQDRLAGIEAGADDFLSKPIDFETLYARLQALIRLRDRTQALDSSEAILMSLALAVEARDPYTHGHCQRLAHYASALGAELRCPPHDLESLRRGGILHDLGKVGMPDAILLKEGKLTPDEFELMKSHTTIGESLCRNLGSLAPICPIIRHHHERLDGSGYPDGLRGDAVPLLAQIIAVVDAFDAMTTNRPYRKALSRDRAYAELRRDVEHGRLSRWLVETFVALVDRDLAHVAA